MGDPDQVPRLGNSVKLYAVISLSNATPHPSLGYIRYKQRVDKKLRCRRQVARLSMSLKILLKLLSLKVAQGHSKLHGRVSRV